MTTHLATTTTTEFAFTPKSIEDAQNLAAELAKSVLVPKDFKGKPADVFAAITYGHELGLQPWAAMQSLIVIHGRVTMYADAMVALVLASDKCIRFDCIEATAESVTYETERRGSKPTRYTFTAEDAKRAGLDSDTYRKFPQRMLGARAKSFLARDVYPDVLRGLQSAEEIIDIEPANAVETKNFQAPEEPEAQAEPEAPAEQEEASPAEESTGYRDAILGCTDLKQLKALIPQLKTLKGDELAEAQALYAAQEKTIEGNK